MVVLATLAICINEQSYPLLLVVTPMPLPGHLVTARIRKAKVQPGPTRPRGGLLLCGSDVVVVAVAAPLRREDALQDVGVVAGEEKARHDGDVRDGHVELAEREGQRYVLAAEVLQALQEREDEAAEEEEHGGADHAAEGVLAVEHRSEPCLRLADLSVRCGCSTVGLFGLDMVGTCAGEAVWTEVLAHITVPLFWVLAR